MVTASKNPKVFLCHASEDKAFVTELAERLLDSGVDAWFDKWEIQVGDNIVQRIFREGIPGCDAFLIVLSSISVQKPWVREELDAAFVDHLDRATKLLALRIDDCEIPLVLKSKRWLRVTPGESYGAEYQELLAAIFGTTVKPPLGSPPPHLQRRAAGYGVDETAVWDALIKLTSKHGLAYFNAASIHEALPQFELAKLGKIVDLLEHDGMARVQGMSGGDFYVDLTANGWYRRAGDVLQFDAADDARRALSSVSCDGACSGEELATRTDIESVRLMMAIEYLEWRGYVTCCKTTGRGLECYYQVDCTPAGHREVSEA